MVAGPLSACEGGTQTGTQCDDHLKSLPPQPSPASGSQAGEGVSIRREGDGSANRACVRSGTEGMPGLGLHQPALVDRRADERCEQRMRLERPRLQLGMKLHADKPGMVFVLDHLRQEPVG